ncbi:MAG: phosphatidate cytidylyltransferase [Deltaproteobacteria bacterium]|jgi:phosphatidate cytidylyltransferase|nr:phosphatidate cytidylyltransferase [Deltaproteobacteria bacterium]
METQLKQRICTAGVLLAILAGALYLGYWGISVLSVAAYLCISWEFYSMKKDCTLTAKIVPIIISIVFLVSFGSNLFFPEFSMPVILAIMLISLPSILLVPLFFTLFAIYCCWQVNKVGLNAKVVKRLSDHTWLGIFYIWILGSITFLSPLLFLTAHISNVHMIGILIVIFSDTFAYFGGKKFGKSLCSPNISPKKTWAGVYFGLLGSIVALSLYLHIQSYFFDYHNSIRVAIIEEYIFGRGSYYASFPIIEGLILGIVAQFGDLFESLIKRINGVKDSGNLLPGHGGVLDRLDALLFVVPFIIASMMVIGIVAIINAMPFGTLL